MKLKAFIEKLNIPLFSERRALATLAINFTLSLLGYIYILLRLNYLNSDIPLWYTKPWGDYQLAPNVYIFLLPTLSLILTILATWIINFLYKTRNKDAAFVTITFITIATSFLYISLLRIVEKSSSPFRPIVDSRFLEMIPLMMLGFMLCAFIVPFVINFAKKQNMITDPTLHKHPGMILKKPSARGGALAFYLAFVAVALIFVPLNRETIALYVGTLLTTLIGLADDKRDINPYIRFIMMAIVIVITFIIGDFHIYYIANPIDGPIRLDFIQFPIEIGDLKFTFIPVADLFAVIWVVWVMNMLSWSNAVDGQFSGMTAITCIVTSILALRLLKIDPEQIYVAKIAAVAAGASLGILPYNWHPSKIMWGFGATTMGLVIAVLSLMAGAKVAVATLVLIVPVLDSLITIGRRVLQKKSPLMGDRGHLHHRLLDMGFSQPTVSVFYWILTAFFGAIALVASGSTKFLALLTLGGVVAFILVAMNLKGELGKLKSQEPGK